MIALENRSGLDCSGSRLRERFGASEWLNPERVWDDRQTQVRSWVHGLEGVNGMSDFSGGTDFVFLGKGDEGYFEEESRRRKRVFDERLLQEPTSVLGTRPPLIFSENAATSDAMRAMQAKHSGVVLVTPDGSGQSPLVGIFTERDILLRVINRGRNPAETPLSEMMTRDPEALGSDARLAWVLNMMSVGGFRHVPLVNSTGWPVGVISVRDIVEFLVASFPNEILNLPPDFGARSHLPRDGA